MQILLHEWKAELKVAIIKRKCVLKKESSKKQHRIC